MKRSIHITIAIIGLIALTFTGCKKGEKDPFLSLKSRKARITGTWELKDFSGESQWGTSPDNLTSDYTYSYADGKLQSTDESGETEEFGYSWTLEFDEDGNYKRTIDYSEEGTIDMEHDEGGYLFMDKNKSADIKKGQFINLIQTAQSNESDNGTNTTTIDQSMDGYSYEIVRLTDDEMIIRWVEYYDLLFKYHLDNSEDSDYENFNAELTFEKK